MKCFNCNKIINPDRERWSTTYLVTYYLLNSNSIRTYCCQFCMNELHGFENSESRIEANKIWTKHFILIKV